MDRRERAGDALAAMIAYGEGLQAGIWTAMPGIIQSFNATQKTCVVQPAIKAQVLDAEGTTSWVALPLLLDCPVQFPSGGGLTLTFPLALNDECLVIFASRCIDAWWQSGGIQVQAELRMHDLSDGFVIPGVSSLVNVPASIATDAAELRNTAGTLKVRIKPSTNELSVIAPGAQVKVSPNRVDIDGVLWINGLRYIDHVHSGVQAGGSNTGGVV